MFDLPEPEPGVLGAFDVGRFHVRSGPRPESHLMIAGEDRKAAPAPWLLGVEIAPRAFRLVGWIDGADARVDRYWTGSPAHRLHGRVPHECWAVPARDLRPLSTLP